jgi:hypothetical protein
VAVGRELVLKGDDVGGIQHEVVSARITEWGLRW